MTVGENKTIIDTKRPENEQPVLKQFRRYVPGTKTEAEKLAQVNPNYDPNDRAWSHNCQRCVIAYELIERGYDVTARPYNAKDKFGDVATRAFNVPAPNQPLTIPDTHIVASDILSLAEDLLNPRNSLFNTS